MPIPFFNFMSQSPQGYGPGDLLGSIIEGYRAGKLPMQMRQEEQQRNQLIQQLMLGNEKAGMENQFLPTKLGQEEEKRDLGLQTDRLNLSALPKEIQSKLLERALKNQMSQKDLDWIDRLNQSAIDKQRSDIEKNLKADTTSIQKDLAALGIHPGDPLYDEYYRRQAGLPSGRKTPEGTRPLEDMGVNERLDAVKRARNTVNSYPNVIKVQNNIKSMREIIKENPKIAGSLAAAFIDPNDPGITSLIASYFTSKKDKTAIQKFQKLASDINLLELGAFGSQVTDARQKLQQATKASANLTPESILFILDKMEYDKAPYKRYVDAVKAGLKDDYEVIDDIEAFRETPNVPDDLSGFTEE